MLVIELKNEDKSKPKLYTDLRKLKKESDSPLNFGQNYYIHKLPRFPEWIRGKVYRYANYKMDLYNLTCSCESQKEKREHYEARDVRRLCKHLYYKILKTSAAKELDSLTLELMKNAVVWGETYLYKYVYQGKDIILGFKEKVVWVNVYAPNRFLPDDYHRFSFNPISNRWSYGSQPKYSELIADVIKRVIRYNLPFEHAYLKKIKLLSESL